MRTTVLVTSLLAMLGLVMSAAGYIWWELREVNLGLHGTLALVAGVFISLGLGVVLMYLLFYSARSGHDDTIE